MTGVAARWRILLVGTQLSLACAGDATAPVPPSRIVFAGRVERSALVVASLVDSAGAAVGSAVTWSVSPATAAEVRRDTIVWRDTGPVTVSASVMAPDGATRARVERVVTVARPPRLVFWALRSISGTGNRDIWTVDLDGGGLRRVTTDAADERWPTARNGQVVFVRFGPSGTADLWRTPLDGGTAVRLTTDATREESPRWSPDGSQLAWVDATQLFFRVWLRNADGTQPRRFAPADVPIASLVEGVPAWSPDGARLVFPAQRDTAGGSAPTLWIGAVNGAGGSATPLAGGPGLGVNTQPTWSPDGAHVVFVSTRDGPADLYRVQVTTRTTARLTTGCRCGEPAFLGDGRLVFVQFADSAGTTTRRLRWLDPAAPSVTYPIATGGDAEGPQPALP